MSAGDDLRIIAVDWSGRRVGAEKTIWLAEVARGDVVRLENGRTREEMASHLIALAAEPAPIVAGLDFAFSMPLWYLRALGVGSGPELWSRARQSGERWLEACEPPFWGRPGKPRPLLPAAFRRGETAHAPGSRPKSVFQVGGAGSVGSGSLRGMPVLHALREAGFGIWPFGPQAKHTIIEIYPRWLSGRVVKSRADARAAYLRAHVPPLPPVLRRRAESSEDAFDAVVAALRMWEHRAELATLPPPRDERERIEGAIWAPAPLRAAVPPPP
ncbi:MAG: DUF429 domain-containing protein [Dehalococcoidia bacterium]|nr:DUF429 domain-containing protein [Dehalococcoidia bacterium]